MTEDGELIVGEGEIDVFSETADEPETDLPVQASSVESEPVAETPEPEVTVAVTPQEAAIKPVAESKPAVSGNDVLKIYAEKGSWMSVRDASNKRLLYNTVPVGGSKVLRGLAPFKISLGNVDSTSLQLNDQAIDMSEHVRKNNTATITVSTGEQGVIFH